MDVNQLEVWLAKFPFSDYKDFKIRPCLILSKNNSSENDLVVLPITSILKENEFSLIIENESLEYGFLYSKSRVKINKVYTIDKTLLTSKIGKLKKEYKIILKEKLIKFLF